jgi:PAS domain S-box-containing protein
LRSLPADSQTWLITCLRSIADAVITTDRTGHVTFLNPAAERLTGLAESAARGLPLEQILKPDPVVPVLDPRGGAVRAVVGADGQRLLLEETNSLIRRTDGELMGVVLVLHDITERVRDEQRQQFLAEASAVLLSSFDYAETLSRVARLAIPRLADWCVIDLFEEDSVRRVAVAHADPSQEEALRATPRPENPAGSRSEMLVPLIARGRTLGTIICGLSQSQRGFGAADLGTAQDLADRAAFAIDNGRLYREAREAIQARNEFLSMASHELRTPLTSLRLGADSLLRYLRKGTPQEIPQAVVERLIDTFNRQIERSARLINQMLDTSRMNLGRMQLEREQMDLTALTQEVLSGLAHDTIAAGCMVYLQAPNPVQGTWDRLRVEQIVNNLVTNAIRFGAGKPITIQVEAHDGVARLVVADEGAGIPPEQQREIFQPFKRLGPARPDGGLGLGLYIIRCIVEAHNGTISVESEPGKGAKFVVELPREQSA